MLADTTTPVLPAPLAPMDLRFRRNAAVRSTPPRPVHPGPLRALACALWGCLAACVWDPAKAGGCTRLHCTVVGAALSWRPAAVCAAASRLSLRPIPAGWSPVPLPVLSPHAVLMPPRCPPPPLSWLCAPVRRRRAPFSRALRGVPSSRPSSPSSSSSSPLPSSSGPRRPSPHPCPGRSPPASCTSSSRTIDSSDSSHPSPIRWPFSFSTSWPPDGTCRPGAPERSLAASTRSCTRVWVLTARGHVRLGGCAPSRGVYSSLWTAVQAEEGAHHARGHSSKKIPGYCDPG